MEIDPDSIKFVAERKSHCMTVSVSKFKPESPLEIEFVPIK